MDESSEEAVLVVGVADLEEVRDLARMHAVEVTEMPHLGLEPVTTVTLLLVGGAAAVAAVRAVLDERRGGQVIDLSSAKPHFYRDPGLMYGLVLLIAVDGTVKIEVHQPKTMFGQVIEALASTLGGLGGATVTEARSAALDSVAERGHVVGG